MIRVVLAISLDPRRVGGGTIRWRVKRNKVRKKKNEGRKRKREEEEEEEEEGRKK
jgi:hypothetical protein